ncbi:ABC-2 type transport system permease protein [Tamaricihabitans halophyticus]|uniref:ABC-2 type transport system permease protein n=1 Tax=Tamaricihabitans halophyticus TaxID=1262583 RepID=A0A4R2R4S3_9PSEU|nr:ABC transporter permease [Tamaricihabitans halophyticus]TCP57007.1 ABC-2 type transport system permease protein [Tamaricihabitans halophyticus]
MAEQQTPLPPDIASSRSWTRAFADIREGLHRRELWSHLGWQDIKQKYRRSVLGPLWITIATGAMVLGLGLIYSTLFGQEVKYFLPYLTTGFIIWQFILNCVTEGSETFISNEGVMKHLPAPLTVYVLRTLWRQCLMLAHNAIIYLIILAIFFADLLPEYTMAADGDSPVMPGLNWEVLLFIPAFLLLLVNAAWVVLLFGVVSTRFRDIPQLINSLITLAFYLTPIVWSPDLLASGGRGFSHFVVQFNPLYHFVNIVRAPLIGQQVEWLNWVVVIGFALVGWTVALFVMRNYRARVSYWV